MTNDYVVDSAIAQLRALADGATQELRALAEKMNELTEAAAKRSFSASSRNSRVTATVNGKSELLALRIATVDRRRPDTEQLSADLTAAIVAAREVAGRAVGERVRRVFEGDL